MSNNIYCTSCGEGISSDFAYCPSCGSKNEKFISTKNSSSTNTKTAKQDAFKKNKQHRKQEVADGHKTISTVKLIYIILALLVVATVILFSSGIFDSPATVQSSTANTTTDPNNPHVGVDLSKLEQITELQKTVDANPSNLDALLNLAHLLNDSGFKEKAIERYEQYLKQNSKVADVWVDMGVCYFELGKNSEAISKMEKALTIEPKHQIAHLNLGIVNLSSGNKEKALSWWKKAVEIDPVSEIGKRAQELINQH
jgi:cytochrome c-type biogenesis protein CcmH/NrfG